MMAMLMRPTVHFHPDETAFPTNIETMLQYSQLIDSSEWSVKAPYGSLNVDNLEDQARTCGNSCCLHSNGTFWAGLEPRQLNQSAPYYVNYYEQGDHWYLQYVFLYMFNPGYTKDLGRVQVELGVHEADAEHVTMEFQGSTLTRVYYAAHSDRDGAWFNASEITMNDGSPVVYSALGSHASYPKDGTWVRCWFVTNDQCGRGVTWRPDAIQVVGRWGNYSGYLGANIYTKKCHVQAFTHQSWWNHETNQSATTWGRVVDC